LAVWACLDCAGISSAKLDADLGPTDLADHVRSSIRRNEVMKPSFHTPLDLEYLDGKDYRLLTAFQYDASGFTVTVPAGFVTDFASIPSLFWNILPPTGKYGKAAVVHDYMYRTPDAYSKEIADATFLEAMGALGVGWFTRYTMYLAVRAFGSSSYRGGIE
jgi:hypothetical protein